MGLRAERSFYENKKSSNFSDFAVGRCMNGTTTVYSESVVGWFPSAGDIPIQSHAIQLDSYQLPIRLGLHST